MLKNRFFSLNFWNICTCGRSAIQCHFFLLLIISSNSWTTFAASWLITTLFTFSYIFIFPLLFPFVIDSSSSSLLFQTWFFDSSVYFLQHFSSASKVDIKLSKHINTSSYTCYFLKTFIAQVSLLLEARVRVVTLNSKCCLFKFSWFLN